MESKVRLLKASREYDRRNGYLLGIESILRVQGDASVGKVLTSQTQENEFHLDCSLKLRRQMIG